MTCLVSVCLAALIAFFIYANVCYNKALAKMTPDELKEFKEREDEDMRAW